MGRWILNTYRIWKLERHTRILILRRMKSGLEKQVTLDEVSRHAGWDLDKGTEVYLEIIIRRKASWVELVTATE